MCTFAERCAPALAVLEALAADGGPVIAAIDGRCGSGKSTFAAWAAQRLGCAVVHTDDFYLPLDARRPDWRRIPCANMDLARLRAEVLAPFLAGEQVLYHPYRCGEGRFGADTVIPAGGLLLVEGSYSHHPLLADHYRLKIFLTCSPQVQQRRLQAREGTRYIAFQEIWIPLEEAYFRQYGIGQDALCIDTGESSPPSQRQEGA